VTVDAHADYTFRGTVSFEVADLPAGKALLLTPDLACDRLGSASTAGRSSRSSCSSSSGETLGLGTLVAAGVGLDLDVIMNKEALSSTVVPDLDSVPKRISIEGPKTAGLQYAHASAEVTLSPVSVSRIRGGIETRVQASFVPEDPNAMPADRSPQENAQQQGLDQLRQDRTAARVCPKTQDWHARIGAVQFGEHNDILRALSLMVSSGMISVEDLGVDPIKELLKGDPTDLVSSAPEIKALRDIFDKVSPNSDVTDVVDKVADGVASVQQAVAKPVEHAATAVVSVGNKACSKVKRLFSKHPC
jgi:hypothetical protein